MKIRVWVFSTTIPERGEGPCMPSVFGGRPRPVMINETTPTRRTTVGAKSPRPRRIDQ
jgi:hypothetical protein